MPSADGTRITLARIAELAGVSTAVASLVVNGKAGPARIAAATQERVLALVAEHGYQTNRVARSLRLRRTHTIGLMLPDSENPFFAQLVSALADVARTRGLTILIAPTGDDAERERDILAGWDAQQVDGLLVASATPVAPRTHLPCVFIDRVVDDAVSACVTTDNVAAAEALTTGLLRRGAQQVAFVGGDLRLSTTRERQEGWLQAHHAAGHQPGPSLLRDYRPAWGCEAAKQLGNCDGVFAAACPLLDGLLRGGSAVIHWAVMDDQPLLDHLRVRVDSARQDVEGMAVDALDLLADLLTGRPGRLVRRPARIIRRG